jgi:MFS family permease
LLHHHRRAHARIAAGLFAGLGTQVGAWAVLVPDLVATRGLTPAALGAVLALMAATSIAALAAAGPLADRFGRRPLAACGAAGFAAAFALLATVDVPAALWPTVALYGVASGFLDLAANAVGSDYERAHDVRAMIRLHAGFSAAAATAALGAAALAAATDASTAYAVVAALYIALAAAVTRAPLPPHETGADRESVAADAVAASGADRESAAAAAGRGLRGIVAARAELLRVPAVAVAVALCTVCFFGDGAIEGYSALFLRDVLASGALTTGVALAAFHGASLAGRLLSARLVDARGERFVLTVAGLLASAGMAMTVAAGVPALAAGGLLVVGLALAPVIPTALSLAGRSAPGRRATAVSLVTTIGYSAFVLGPPLVGALAGLTSLRIALVPVVVSTAAIALLARSPGVTYAPARSPSRRKVEALT